MRSVGLQARRRSRARRELETGGRSRTKGNSGSGAWRQCEGGKEDLLALAMSRLRADKPQASHARNASSHSTQQWRQRGVGGHDGW
jgi:hypothetical protein